MRQTNEIFSNTITRDVKYNFLLHLPKEYNDLQSNKWPLIIFLHGAGERGDNVEIIKEHGGLPKVIENGLELPCVVASPQCPANSFWVNELQNLNYFIDTLVEGYNIDIHRIYLTGMSMGGFGTWYLAMAYPEKFAAIAPICGGGMSWNAKVLNKIPVWAFHGAKDPVVPLFESENMIETLKNCGAKEVKFTVYPEAKHDSWTETYMNKDLYKWFLSHRKEEV